MMRPPALGPLVAGLLRGALPLAIFAALWGAAHHIEQRALDSEQAHTWTRFQRAAMQQINRLRRELAALDHDAADAREAAVRLLGDRRDARDVSLEIIDLGGTHPQPIYRDPDLRPMPMVYAEQIEFGDRRWLAEVSPLPNHYTLTPSSTVEVLQWGGPLLATLGALLAFVLQSRTRAVRRQVLRQTAALERANHQLEHTNSALKAEIERRARSEATLRDTTGLQRAILDSADYAIVSTDGDGLIQLFNPAAERIFGWRADEVLGCATPRLFYAEDELARLDARHGSAGFASLVADARRHRQSLLQELSMRRKDGSTFPASLSISPLLGDDGTVCGYLGIAADISQHKAAESRIRFLAHYDALTELPNRSLLGQRLTEALERSQRQGERLAVLFLDLDRFKYVNDSLGHHAGDLLLQAVSRRFMNCVREDDTVARMGGDEFVILLPALPDRDHAAEIAERIVAALAEPLEVRGQRLTITPSIGIAVYPDDGPDGETLIKNADAAMYLAKEEGRNGYRFYARELSGHVSERLQVENELRQALEEHDFELHYQPQFDVASGEITGIEALLRWRHPQRGLVAPDRFIPIAEDSGLIVPIGEWVLRAACEQVRAWRRAGLLAVPVAVNLSARQFDQPRLAEQIAGVLADTGLEAGQLELELTESLVMRDPERSSETLNRCKALGVEIAIDDFGTGYSSLAYLRRFPIDRLKIDRSFIKDIVTEPDDAAIAQTIVAMAHSLRLTVVAEGVEDAAQLRLLQRWGCDSYQGFLTSRPLPGAQMTALLAGMRAAGIAALPLPLQVEA